MPLTFFLEAARRDGKKLGSVVSGELREFVFQERMTITFNVYNETWKFCLTPLPPSSPQTGPST